MHADKNKTLRLLKTVRGQIDGLIKMIEENRYCIEISTQLMASQSILKKINLDILKGHLNHCIKESINKTEAERDKKIAELITVLDKLMK